MELTGNEKRIQALFSERSREDAQNAPRFEKLWSEASVRKREPRFSKSLIAIAATLIVAIAVFFVAWSRNRTPVNQHAQNVAPQQIAIPTAPEAENREQESREAENKVVRPRTPSYSSRRRTLARRQQRERALEQAAMLANWKSPTEQFMTAPVRSGFNSLPQLTEAANDLQSFLGKKESNQ